MPRMSKKDKQEWGFYLDENGRISYNELCRNCDRECKQSFRAVIISCPEYVSIISRMTRILPKKHALSKICIHYG